MAIVFTAVRMVEIGPQLEIRRLAELETLEDRFGMLEI